MSQLEGLVTLQKNDYKYFLALIVLSFLTLYYRERYLIVLLTILAFAFVFMKNKDFGRSDNLDNLKSRQLNNEVNLSKQRPSLKLNQIFNAIPSPLVYFNYNGDIEVANNYFNQIIGRPAKNVYDNTIDYTIRNILIEESINRNQFIKRINYDSIDYQVHAIPIFNDEIYLGSIMVFQDVTQIVESENMQKRFISDASHELRTPITSIMGMVEILNRPHFDDEETQREFLYQIENDVKSLDHLVKDLLLQSKMRENKLYLDKVIFDLRHLFDNILYDLRKDLKKANIKVELDCPSNISVFADQFRLSQVFVNLINNSINYTENGIITITASASNNQVDIIISDNGKGINKDILPYIFDRFYRGQSDRGRKVGGSGLGLAISKSIIQAHGGSIEVKSEENKGTTFIIKLTQS